MVNFVHLFGNRNGLSFPLYTSLPNEQYQNQSKGDPKEKAITYITFFKNKVFDVSYFSFILINLFKLYIIFNNKLILNNKKKLKNKK